MKRVLGYAALTVMTMAAVACSNSSDNSGSPTSPTPTNPTVTVRSVVVTAAPTSTTQYQMTAKADLSDGTSRDVTSQSQWTVSAADLASVSAGGVLTVLHSGDVDVRATFQSTTGAMHLSLNAPQPPPPDDGGAMFILSGVIHEPAPGAAPIGGVLMKIVAGPETGKSVMSSNDGHFGLLPLHAGELTIEATKTGYNTYRATVVIDHDMEIDVVMTPVMSTTSR